jgi:fluoroacetyl-CoA thioesterase
MREDIKPGLEHTVTHIVDDARAINFMGDDLRVYATPSIVNDLEYGCRDLLKMHQPDDEDSVGAYVEVEHLRPTPMGFEATHKIVIESVDGRRVTFAIEVNDGVELVARGHHTRMIVKVERLKAIVAAKKG